MNNLIKPCQIKREKLSEEYYFQSLIQQGCETNLLTNTDMEAIQVQTVELLAKQTERFTRGDSSSIRIETAQSLMLSVFYCISVYLKSLLDIETSITYLKEKPLFELFKNGRDIIDIKVKSAKKLYESVIQTRINTVNQAYNDTLDTGIPPFFVSYDAEFAAHDAAGSIDYPLSIDKMNLVGVEYMCSYLEKLFYENQFCHNFSHGRIHSLLTGYSRNYKDLLINIFDIVLINGLGCLISNKNPRILNITPQECANMQQRMRDITREELDVLLKDTSAKLFEQLNISDKEFQKYIMTATQNASVRIKNALENNSLEAVFIYFEEDDEQTSIRYEDGVKMKDEIFRKITDEIRECRYVSDKIEIIHKNIGSIEDLADILESSCVFDDEFDKIYESLGDMELALLLKRISSNLGDLELCAVEAEREWENKLLNYLESIALERKNQINIMHHNINIVED